MKIPCKTCKKLMQTYPSRVKRGSSKYCSIECRNQDSKYIKKISGYGQSLYGIDNHNWRGGKTKGRNLLMAKQEYKDWRKAVYERDGYACVHCGVAGNGKNLQADHIKPYALYPDLVFDIDNGRTLCISCHKATDTYGWKLFNDMKWKKICRV